MRDNTAVMERFAPLNADEQDVIRKVQAALAAVPAVPCTNCQYCLKGCPQNVNIPGTFKVYGDYLLHQNAEQAKMAYGWETRVLARASACVACGACESVCPQRIPVARELARAAKVLC
jgi:predicted aldo/keto reductase-like oxidoreductase